MPAEGSPAAPPGFEAFRCLVLSDAALQAELRRIPDQKTLFARVLELGRERGYEFPEQDLVAEINRNRRGWIERFLHQ